EQIGREECPRAGGDAHLLVVPEHADAAADRGAARLALGGADGPDERPALRIDEVLVAVGGRKSLRAVRQAVAAVVAGQNDELRNAARPESDAAQPFD